MWFLTSSPAHAASTADFCDLPSAGWDARVDAQFKEESVGAHGDKAARAAPPPATARFDDVVSAWTAQRAGPTHVVMLSVDAVPCGLTPREPSAWSPRFGTLYRTDRDDVFVTWPDAGDPFHAMRVLDEDGWKAVVGPLEPFEPLDRALRTAIGRHDRHAAIAAATPRHLHGDFALYDAFELGELKRSTNAADLSVDVAGLLRALDGLDPARKGGPQPEDFARYQRLAHGFIDALRTESQRGVSMALTSYLVETLPDYGAAIDPAKPRALDYARVVSVLKAVETALAPPPATLEEILAARRALPETLPWLDGLRLRTQAAEPLADALADVDKAVSQKRYATAIGEASLSFAVGKALGIAVDPRLEQVEQAARSAFVVAVCPGPARKQDRAAVLAALTKLPIASGLDALAVDALHWTKGTVRFDDVSPATLGDAVSVDGTFGLPSFRDGEATVSVSPDWLAWKVQHELAFSEREAGLDARAEGAEPPQLAGGRKLETATVTPYFVREVVFPVTVRSAWTIDGKRVEDVVTGAPIHVVRATADRADFAAFTEAAARAEAMTQLPSTASVSSRPYDDAVKASLAAYLASRNGAAGKVEARWAEQVASGR